ncbi:MAG: cobalamin biosynthesis protein CobD, partial [Clostridiaceae bacterium]|nr:cobalamin biosynthesis protein CobD [Clostridiaceae bacterium]
MLMLLTGQADDLIYQLMPGVEQGSSIWLIAFVLVSSWPLLAGFMLDMAIGDPRWLPHPIRLIGWSIKTMEKLLRSGTNSDSRKLRRRGAALAVLIPLMTALASAALLLLAWKLHFVVGLILETVFCWLILATRSLMTETRPVHQALDHGDLEAARERISWLVGRDTAELDRENIVKAAVETIAENTNDGVTAPLFYMALGGPVLGMAYKAINTLDSMVGYRNEHYIFFGRCSARLDDAAGFLTARISALLMIIAAALLK